MISASNVYVLCSTTSANALEFKQVGILEGAFTEQRQVEVTYKFGTNELWGAKSSLESLMRCRSLKEFPNSICELECHIQLDLSECESSLVVSKSTRELKFQATCWSQSKMPSGCGSLKELSYCFPKVSTS